MRTVSLIFMANQVIRFASVGYSLYSRLGQKGVFQVYSGGGLPACACACACYLTSSYVWSVAPDKDVQTPCTKISQQSLAK